MSLLTVGQMAKLNHVSEQTLRLYDRLGLFSPNTRGENGYRYYNIKQSAVLDVIQYMKSLGISLKEIKRQFDSGDLSYIEDALRQKQQGVREEIQRLKRQERAIERTIESLERYRNAPPDGTIFLEYIGNRQMYVIDSGINFYDYGVDTYEVILRDLQTNLVKNRLPQIYFCNAGTVLNKDNFLSKQFYSTQVFVFVDKEFVDPNFITSIPACHYVCIYCDSFYKEKEYAEKLLTYIQSQNYQICGDYLCEAITDLPISHHEERRFYLRLQVPVKFI